MAVYKFVIDVLKWPQQYVILWGSSIGTGCCARLANKLTDRHPTGLGGLILQCPYKNIIEAVASFVGPLARLLVRQRWDVESDVKSVKCPVLWIHGVKDELFNVQGSKDMFKKFKNAPKMGHFPPEADHFTFDFTEDLCKPIKRFLKRCVRTSPLITNIEHPGKLILDLDSTHLLTCRPSLAQIEASRHIGKREPGKGRNLRAFLRDFDTPDPAFQAAVIAASNASSNGVMRMPPLSLTSLGEAYSDEWHVKCRGLVDRHFAGFVTGIGMDVLRVHFSMFPSPATLLFVRHFLFLRDFLRDAVAWQLFPDASNDRKIEDSRLPTSNATTASKGKGTANSKHSHIPFAWVLRWVRRRYYAIAPSLSVEAIYKLPPFPLPPPSPIRGLPSPVRAGGGDIYPSSPPLPSASPPVNTQHPPFSFPSPLRQNLSSHQPPPRVPLELKQNLSLVSAVNEENYFLNRSENNNYSQASSSSSTAQKKSFWKRILPSTPPCGVNNSINKNHDSNFITSSSMPLYSSSSTPPNSNSFPRQVPSKPRQLQEDPHHFLEPPSSPSCETPSLPSLPSLPVLHSLDVCGVSVSCRPISTSHLPLNGAAFPHENSSPPSSHPATAAVTCRLDLHTLAVPVMDRLRTSFPEEFVNNRSLLAVPVYHYRPHFPAIASWLLKVLSLLPPTAPPPSAPYNFNYEPPHILDMISRMAFELTDQSVKSTVLQSTKATQSTFNDCVPPEMQDTFDRAVESASLNAKLISPDGSLQEPPPGIAWFALGDIGQKRFLHNGMADLVTRLLPDINSSSWRRLGISPVSTFHISAARQAFDAALIRGTPGAVPLRTPFIPNNSATASSKTSHTETGDMGSGKHILHVASLFESPPRFSSLPPAPLTSIATPASLLSIAASLRPLLDPRIHHGHVLGAGGSLSPLRRAPPPHSDSHFPSFTAPAANLPPPSSTAQPLPSTACSAPSLPRPMAIPPANPLSTISSSSNVPSATSHLPLHQSQRRQSLNLQSSSTVHALLSAPSLPIPPLAAISNATSGHADYLPAFSSAPPPFVQNQKPSQSTHHSFHPFVASNHASVASSTKSSVKSGILHPNPTNNITLVKINHLIPSPSRRLSTASTQNCNNLDNNNNINNYDYINTINNNNSNNNNINSTNPFPALVPCQTTKFGPTSDCSLLAIPLFRSLDDPPPILTNNSNNNNKAATYESVTNHQEVSEFATPLVSSPVRIPRSFDSSSRLDGPPLSTTSPLKQPNQSDSSASLLPVSAPSAPELNYLTHIATKESATNIMHNFTPQNQISFSSVADENSKQLLTASVLENNPHHGAAPPLSHNGPRSPVSSHSHALLPRQVNPLSTLHPNTFLSIETAVLRLLRFAPTALPSAFPLHPSLPLPLGSNLDTATTPPRRARPSLPSDLSPLDSRIKDSFADAVHAHVSLSHVCATTSLIQILAPSLAPPHWPMLQHKLAARLEDQIALSLEIIGHQSIQCQSSNPLAAIAKHSAALKVFADPINVASPAALHQAIDASPKLRGLRKEVIQKTHFELNLLNDGRPYVDTASLSSGSVSSTSSESSLLFVNSLNGGDMAMPHKEMDVNSETNTKVLSDSQKVHQEIISHQLFDESSPAGIEKPQVYNEFNKNVEKINKAAVNLKFSKPENQFQGDEDSLYEEPSTNIRHNQQHKNKFGFGKKTFSPPPYTLESLHDPLSTFLHDLKFPSHQINLPPGFTFTGISFGPPPAGAIFINTPPPVTPQSSILHSELPQQQPISWDQLETNGNRTSDHLARPNVLSKNKSEFIDGKYVNYVSLPSNPALINHPSASISNITPLQSVKIIPMPPSAPSERRGLLLNNALHSSTNADNEKI